MALALEARLYKWLCYRCAREVFSPTNASCPDCAFPLVIECDESPAPSLWQDELVQAQRSLRVPTPLLLVALDDVAVDGDGDLAAPPEVVSAPTSPPSPARRMIDAALPIRAALLTFAGVALATFVVAWAVAAAIQFGF
jgi:hypothetical protein